MDRGIPTEAVLAQMRQADPPIHYLVGTPKERLSKLEKALLDKAWQGVRHGVGVKFLPQDQEFYVLARSRRRVHKERAMRRQLKQLWVRLTQMATMELTHEAVLMKLGAARAKPPAVWRLDIAVAEHVAAFSFTPNRANFRKVRKGRQREGRHPVGSTSPRAPACGCRRSHRPGSPQTAASTPCPTTPCSEDLTISRFDSIELSLLAARQLGKLGWSRPCGTSEMTVAARSRVAGDPQST